MLGWEVTVYRDLKESAWQSTVRWFNRTVFKVHRKAKLGPVVADWKTSFFGISWIDELVKEGKATYHGGYGYPSKFTMKANVLLPILNVGLPANNSPLLIGDDYFVPEKWSGEVIWNHEVAAACHPDETLILHAWDQS